MKRNWCFFKGHSGGIGRILCGRDNMEYGEQISQVRGVKTADIENEAVLDEADAISAPQKLSVIFTVDVEDNRGNKPYLIEGDLTEFGIKENCGVNYIMDTFERYNSKAVFFVNIFEHNLYDAAYMPSLLHRMNDRGHEVALHAHTPSDASMDFYTKSLTDYALEGQKAILSYGKEYIYEAIGKYPIAYRSGAYHMNDDTFKALSEVGFLVDSSVYYGHRNNEFREYASLKNQIFQVDGCIEIPVEVIFNGSTWKKLDIDFLTEEEIYKALDVMRKSGMYDTVQIMFHSFSCMDVRNKGNGALVQEGNKMICGENLDTKEKLNNILANLSESEEYEIITFEDYIARGQKIPKYADDNLIYLDNKEMAYDKNDIEVETGGITLFMNNKLRGNGLMYAWDVYNANNVKEKYSSGYSLSGEYEMSFPETVSGIYYVKSYVKNSNNTKIRGTYYRATVVNGVIESIDDY